MSYCELLEPCPFFNDELANKPGMSAMYKMNYCRGDYKSCARYMVSKELGKEKVPVDLYPNMCERAKKIIQDSK
ncbi:MAG: hypothetical protein KAS67_05330 [Thermoplasmata archaeon]|nr:hypothetical protein [Thermoplasmata archaeon]